MRISASVLSFCGWKTRYILGKNRQSWDMQPTGKLCNEYYVLWNYFYFLSISLSWGLGQILTYNIRKSLLLTDLTWALQEEHFGSREESFPLLFFWLVDLLAFLFHHYGLFAISPASFSISWTWFSFSVFEIFFSSFSCSTLSLVQTWLFPYCWKEVACTAL